MNEENKFNPKNMSDFFIPEEELDKLADFSNGGFVLFCVSAKNEILVYSHIENQVVGLALEAAIKKHIKNINDDIMQFEEDDDGNLDEV